MCLIQPLKFRTLKTGCFKMPHLQKPHLQTDICQTGITVTSGLFRLPFFRFSNSTARNIRYAIERRIKLMPYIMTQMKFANMAGTPLIRCVAAI